MNALISKARKPRFELNLKIVDLNNVPLVSGTSFVKWYLPSSTSAEHRGRTEKTPIKEHKVIWDYARVIPVRFTMDKANMLQECIISFEVIQELNSGARGEKIALGHINLNLAEYIDLQDQDGEDGIMRRYLMQESKINSTLKIGISMRQLDGERNFGTPPLKTAPVFGGIAGIMDFDQVEDEQGHVPSINRSRETGELQDVYRRTLAASWGAQSGELRADQCIEDIFSGGDGWKSKLSQDNVPAPRLATIPGAQQHSGDEDEDDRMPTLRSHHSRTGSASSGRSMSTITGKSFSAASAHLTGRGHKYSKSGSGEIPGLGSHARTASRTSLDSQLNGSSSENSSERGMYGFKHAHEVHEFSVREDLVAWRLPDTET